MLKNKDYDLMEAISVKSKGLQRYDTYMKDAAACPNCRQMWQRIKDEEEKQVGILVDELKSHVEHENI